MKLRLRGRPVRIETERFVLTTTTRLAAARLSFRWTADPEIMHPIGYRTGWTFRKWYRNLPPFDNKKRFCFAIRPKSEDTIIGFDRFAIDSHDNAFFAVMIGDRAWWGKGVVREVRTALLDLLFGPLGCVRVAGYVASSNYPSIANYHMLGFQVEGVNRKTRRDPAGEGRRDLIIFSILAEEWRARRGPENAA